MQQEQPWIGFVHVQPMGDVNPFGNCKGAYVHGLALATGSEAFCDRICGALEEEGLCVIEIDDIAPVTQYRAEGRIPQDMEDLIGALSSEYPVQFDTFDVYDEYDS